VTVGAAYSKRRRTDVLPLRPDLAARLREWFLERSAVERTEIVALPLHEALEAKRARLWQWGLGREAARGRNAARGPGGGRNRYEENGRVFDFHALRHQFISALAQAGVHPKTAQELARHSTITLTLDCYSHVGLYDQGAAVAAIPALPSPEPEAARATGTDGARATVKPV
jgi:integrase